MVHLNHLLASVLSVALLGINTALSAEFYGSVELIGAVDFSSLLGIRDVSLAYRLVETDLQIDVTGVLSKDAFSELAANTVDFAILARTITGPMIASAPSLYMLPLLTSAYVPIYRIDAIGTPASGAVTLTLSRSVLAMIYAGNITNWSSPFIQAINPGILLPNQSITVMVEGNPSGKNYILKHAFQDFDSTFLNQSGCKIDMTTDWPVNRYARYRVVAAGLTQMVSAVTSVDGSIGISSQSAAVAYSASQAQMINKAGTIVSVSPEALTFAAVDLCLQPLDTRVTAADLTDSASANAWPIVFFNYLIIDAKASRTSCRARAKLIEFILYIYQSNVALSLLDALGYAAVPDALLDQLGVFTFLKTQVMCRSVPALETISSNRKTDRTLGIATAFSFEAQLLTSLYLDIYDHATWVVAEGSDSLLVQEMYNSEIEMILVNPTNINQTMWQQLVATDDYLMIPLFGFATTLFFNPQLTSTFALSTKEPFVLTIEQMIDTITRCISDFNDPVLAINNPWLAPALNQQSYAIHMVAGCGRSPDKAPLMLYLLGLVVSITDSITMSDCSKSILTNALAGALFDLCQSFESYQFEKNEFVIPHLVMGTFGGTGLMISDDDANKILPKLRVIHGDVSYDVSSDIGGILACAYDTFDPASLSFNFRSSRNVSCWPMTQQIVAVVRKQYYNDTSVTNHSSCASGLEALEFLRWMIATQEIDALTDQANIGRLSNVPGTQDAYIQALNSVLCDDDTLLVVSPIIWSLDMAVVVLGYVVFVLGVLMTLWLMWFTISSRKRPALRAASPQFIIMSLCGVLLLFGGVLSLVQPASEGSCMSINVLFSFGLILTFAPVTAKQYRIFKIFGRRKLTIVKITNRTLMGIVCALLTIEACITIPWLAVSPIQPYLHVNQEGSSGRAHWYTQCSVHDSGLAFFALAAAYKGILLVSSALMAFLTRKVSSQFNESSQIALAVYNLLFSLGIIAPVIYAVNAVGTVLVGLLLFVAAWIAFFTAGILVLPKMSLLYSSRESMIDKDETHTSPNESFEFLPLNELQSLPMVVNYLAALKAHSDQVDAKYVMVKKKTVQQEAKSHARNASVAPIRGKSAISPAPRRTDSSLIGATKSPGQTHSLRHTRSHTTNPGPVNDYKDSDTASPSLGAQQGIRNRGSQDILLRANSSSRAST